MRGKRGGGMEGQRVGGHDKKRARIRAKEARRSRRDRIALPGEKKRSVLRGLLGPFLGLAITGTSIGMALHEGDTKKPAVTQKRPDTPSYTRARYIAPYPPMESDVDAGASIHTSETTGSVDLDGLDRQLREDLPDTNKAQYVLSAGEMEQVLDDVQHDPAIEQFLVDLSSRLEEADALKTEFLALVEQYLEENGYLSVAAAIKSAAKEMLADRGHIAWDEDREASEEVADAGEENEEQQSDEEHPDDWQQTAERGDEDDEISEEE